MKLRSGKTYRSTPHPSVLNSTNTSNFFNKPIPIYLLTSDWIDFKTIDMRIKFDPEQTSTSPSGMVIYVSQKYAPEIIAKLKINPNILMINGEKTLSGLKLELAEIEKEMKFGF
jgi:hypothetical protein